jgi:predicted metal-dependent hydrolase
MEDIVFHEMAHMIEPHHLKPSWDLVARILPDWEDRKNQLARDGAPYHL